MARVCIIEIGRELIAAKVKVGHGNWLRWLKEEFGWSHDVAAKYMRVAEAFQISLPAKFDGLTIDASALYVLSAPEAPQQARDEALERGHAQPAAAVAAIAGDFQHGRACGYLRPG